MWLYSNDVGLVGAVLVVGLAMVAGQYAVSWGGRRARQNEANLDELIHGRKRPPSLNHEDPGKPQ